MDTDRDSYYWQKNCFNICFALLSFLCHCKYFLMCISRFEQYWTQIWTHNIYIIYIPINFVREIKMFAWIRHIMNSVPQSNFKLVLMFQFFSYCCAIADWHKFQHLYIGYRHCRYIRTYSIANCESDYLFLFFILFLGGCAVYLFLLLRYFYLVNLAYGWNVMCTWIILLL